MRLDQPTTVLAILLRANRGGHPGTVARLTCRLIEHCHSCGVVGGTHSDDRSIPVGAHSRLGRRRLRSSLWQVHPAPTQRLSVMLNAVASGDDADGLAGAQRLQARALREQGYPGLADEPNAVVALHEQALRNGSDLIFLERIGRVSGVDLGDRCVRGGGGLRSPAANSGPRVLDRVASLSDDCRVQARPWRTCSLHADSRRAAGCRVSLSSCTQAVDRYGARSACIDESSQFVQTKLALVGMP